MENLNISFRYILFGLFLILWGLTLMFMLWNHLIDISDLSEPGIGMELISNNFITMGFVICAIVFFWYLGYGFLRKTRFLK